MRRVIGALLLWLLIISMLSASCVVAISEKRLLTQDDENKIAKSFKGEKGQTSTSLGESSIIKQAENQTGWHNFFERPEKQNSYEEPNETSSKTDYDWSKFTYPNGDKNGNKTRLIIGIGRPSTFSGIKNVTVKHHGEVIGNVTIEGEVLATVVEVPSESIASLVNEIQRGKLGRYIEPDFKVQAQLVPNDPNWSLQLGPQKIEADWAWNTTLGSQDVLVAVVDTGVDYTHPDLAGNYVPLGYDWVNMDADPLDDFGHGTHCAGIIAATINNSIGIAGLAQVRIMAEKVLDMGGWGYWDWVANGIVHATDSGANIISMSLGGYGDSELLHEAVKYAYDHGVLVVAAAGNENTNVKLYPAGYDEAIAVAATDQYDNKAWFSNWGDWIELAAPGVDIYSTMPTYHVTMNDWGYSMNYTYMSGTSMATPHVSGVAALVWSLYPNKTRNWVRIWLQHTADDLGDPGFDVYYGYGRINARKAVEQTPPAHELIAYRWSTPPYIEPGAVGIINATVVNFGESNETSITIQLLANETLINSTWIDFLASGNSAAVSLSWNPTAEGLYNVTLYVVPVPGETSLENNVLWNYIYVGFPVKAVVLRSAGNLYGEIITNWQVLTNQWYLFGGKMVYIDYTTLNKENITYENINATRADVLIISCASSPGMGWEFTDSEIEAITQYVHEGHGLIVTAGTFYYMVPNNSKLAPLLGINETTMWDATSTDLLELLNSTHPVFANVPNPLVFPWVGTAIPWDRRWDLNELFGGNYLALGHYRESAVVAYRGLLYISPWLEIIPPYYHHHLQLIYNAILWSSYCKPQHDLVASSEAPKALKPNNPALLNATVINMGLNNETNVTLQLLINGEVANVTTISELATGDSYTINYMWVPAVEGHYNVTAYATPVPGEDNILNNIDLLTVVVSNRILALCEDSYPWNYPSNEEVFNLYQVPYVTIGSSDFGSLDLSTFCKVVIASDQPQSFYNAIESYRWWFEDYVRSGGVLEIHAAAWGWHGGSWIGPLPGDLQYVSYWSNNVTIVDPSHPVITTPNLISDAELDGWWSSVHGYFQNYPYNSHIVIVEDYTGQPVYLEFDYGAGTIIASSQTLEWAYKQGYSRILENSLLYLSAKYEHDIAVALEASKYVPTGSSAWLNTTVRNRGLNNETNINVYLLINDSIASSWTIPQLAVGESYELGYMWSPVVEGAYNVTAYTAPVENETYVANNKAERLVIVAQPLIRPVEGRYSNYTYYYVDPATGQEYFGGLMNFTYLQYISPYQVNVTIDYSYGYSGWLVVNTFTRRVEMDSGIGWTGMWYPGWVETNVTMGSTVNLLWGNATVVDNEVIYFGGRPIDCWEMELAYYDYTYRLWYDKATGLWFGMFYVSPYQWTRFNLTATNIPVGFSFEHDLTVTLEAPRTSAACRNVSILARVYNTGLSNESDVTLQLIINDSLASSEIINELHVDESYTINYTWIPPSIGPYNVTAYAKPVSGESYVDNNLVTKEVYAFASYTREYLPHQWVGDGVPMGWHADDGSWPYDLPFNFTFYGVNYTTIYISSNGLITFINPDWSYSNSIPALANKLAIAPAWDDWMTNEPYDIYIWQNQTHVGIRWYVAAVYNQSIVANFEAILGSDGMIQFNYEHNNGTVSATVGISNGLGDIIAEDLIDLNFINSILFKPSMIKPIVTVVYVNPPVSNATISSSFNVSLAINNVTDLYLWTIDLRWDPAVMNLTGIWEGPFLKQGGQTAFLWTEINYTGGYIRMLTCTLLEDVPGVNGSGELATFEFKGLAEGFSVIGVSNVALLDSSGVDIPVLVQDGVAYIVRPLPDLYVESVAWPYPEPILYANATTYRINVTVANGGNLDAGPFNVTFTAVYCPDGENFTEYESKVLVPGLAAGNSTTVEFDFKPKHKGVYSIVVWVDSENDVDESNEANNINLTIVNVRLAGDVDGDGDVDYRDLFKLAKAYGSTQSSPSWNCYADFDASGKVDYKDLFLLAQNYGRVG